MGRLYGGLARDDIIKAIHRDPAMPALDAMQVSVPAVTPRHNADELVRHLQAGASMVVVTGPDGRSIGLVTWENMLEHVMIEKARGRGHNPDPA